jgi:hypothetical protein
MEKIFFDTSYSNLQQLFLRIFAFLLTSGLLLYIIYFALSKILFRKNNHPKEINLHLVFLWSLFTYFIVFNGYIFILFYKRGIDSLHWTSPIFYLSIISQMTVYIGIFAFFFIKRHSLKQIINEKSIN